MLNTNPWITWSSNPKLDINLSIRLEGNSGNQLGEEVLKRMLDIIGEASLWSDLNVFPVFEGSVVPNSAESNQLNTNLTIRRNLNRPSKERPFNFPQCVGRMINMNTHIQPPPGVPTYDISQLDIAFKFSPGIGCDKPQAASNLSPSRELCKNQRLPEISGLELYRPSFRRTLSSDQSLLLPESDEEWESLDENSLFSSQESTVTSNSGISPHQISDNPQTTDNGGITLTHSYMRLLDSGFRSLICPSIPLRDVVQTKSQDGKVKIGLADIAPIVFSPGYDAAISERACFIPTIAKGLTMAINKSRNQVLKTKLAALKDRYQQKCDAHSSYSRVNPTDTKAVMTYLLWNRMQTALYNPDARKLSPLYTPSQQTDMKTTATSQHIGSPDEDIFINQDEIDTNWDFDLECDEGIILNDGEDQEEDPFYDMLEIPIMPTVQCRPQTRPSQSDVSDSMDIDHMLDDHFGIITDQDSPYITATLSSSPMLDTERTGSPISNMSLNSEMEVLDDVSVTACSEQILDFDTDDDNNSVSQIDYSDIDSEIEMLL